jgi:hypothetical protein
MSKRLSQRALKLSSTAQQGAFGICYNTKTQQFLFFVGSAYGNLYRFNINKK